MRKDRRRGNTTRCGRSESLLGKELLQTTVGLSLFSPSPPDDSLWGACGNLLMNSLEEKNSVARETTGEESELGESQDGDLAPLCWKKSEGYIWGSSKL